MKTLGFLLFLCGALAADVLVLKSGVKVGGKVVDKQTHYEITTEGVLRTYLKDEVEKVLTGPKDLVGDADASYEAAKKDYETALGLPENDQQGKFKEAISKVAKAREAYSGAIELFPEDDTVGRKLVLIMQLMRLCRERLHSEIASGQVAPRPRVVSPTEPAGGLRVDDSLSILLDAAKRADPSKRSSAIGAFRSQRSNNPDSYDLATAAMMFLSRLDADLKLEGPALKAVQDYFDKGWLKDPQKLTPQAHHEAAAWLSTQLPSLRAKGETAPAVEVLQLFATVHASHATPGPEAEKVAKSLGFVVQGGRIGTAEGHAVHDLDGWIAHGEFDLAVLSFVREYKSIDTPMVRFVWAYALLRTVQAKKRGFERPVGALESVKLSDAPSRDHLDALEKSIKAAAVCNTCGGEGRNRCTNCHGQRETKIVCAKCKGKGHTVSSLGAELLCIPCKSTGFSALIKCEKCKDGYFDCKQCGGKKKTPPEMGDICDTKPCDACDGRGTAFREAYVPCRSCLGLGIKLVPKSDPAKVLR
jgi:tetratricopeptide (TPR) repeat protein